MSSSTLEQLKERYFAQGVIPRGKAYRKILKIERAVAENRLISEWKTWLARQSR